jgi:transposase
MKKPIETLGIDVSKLTLDVFLHVANVYEKFDNTEAGFKDMIKWAVQKGNIKSSQLLICFEHTGIYGIPLATYLEKKNLFYCMVPALEIKKSLGMVRGKDDRVDAKRIAGYGHLRRETIKQTKLPVEVLQRIKGLLALRATMVTQKAGYSARVGELKRIYKDSDIALILSVQRNMIKELKKGIKALDSQIKDLINSDPEIKKIYNLIISVKGIGPVVASHLIVVTQNFTIFENSRKLACYCGVAPFEKQSGSSLKSKSKVSHYANKKMKSLLNIAASSAVQADGELKTYYMRRIEAGKSKMSTLNIVRNKLLHRAFAVVKRQTPYVEIYKHAV